MKTLDRLLLDLQLDVVIMVNKTEKNYDSLDQYQNERNVFLSPDQMMLCDLWFTKIKHKNFEDRQEEIAATFEYFDIKKLVVNNPVLISMFETMPLTVCDFIYDHLQISEMNCESIESFINSLILDEKY